MKIDLGCGQAKTPGFIGVDLRSLPGVDIVHDINKGLPFADNSVEYVIASHSLEHFEDLPFIVAEIFRVCIDRAIVTIAGPYSATRLNESNPYHLSIFNEHTARFWTDDTGWAPNISQAGSEFPGNPQWGLAASDNRSWNASIRLLKSEYFYFPPYRNLSDSLKIEFRRSLTDVCDSFVYHCIVLKTPISEADLDVVSQSNIFIETAGIAFRRQLEQESSAGNIFSYLASLPDQISTLEAKIARLEANITKDQHGSDGNEINKALRLNTD